MGTRKPEHLCDSLYCGISCIAVVQNQTCNIVKGCLYFEGKDISNHSLSVCPDSWPCRHVVSLETMSFQFLSSKNWIRWGQISGETFFRWSLEKVVLDQKVRPRLPVRQGRLSAGLRVQRAGERQDVTPIFSSVVLRNFSSFVRLYPTFCKLIFLKRREKSHWKPEKDPQILKIAIMIYVCFPITLKIGEFIDQIVCFLVKLRRTLYSNLHHVGS